MSTGAVNDYLGVYLDEVQAYIPSLQRGLAALEKGGADQAVVKELHRQVHMIKGASSMVGVTELYRMSGPVEQLLESLMEGEIQLSERILAVIRESVAQIDRFCGTLKEGDDFGHEEVIDHIVEGCRDLLGDSWSDDSGRQEGNGRDESTAIPGSGVHVPPNTGCGNGSGEMNKNIVYEFKEEAEGYMCIVHDELVNLSAGIAEEAFVSPGMRERLENIRRLIHTLKGASGIMKFDQLSVFCGEMEAALRVLVSRAVFLSPAVIETLTEAVILVETMIHDPEGTGRQESAALLGRLDSMTEKLIDGLDPAAGRGGEPIIDVPPVGTDIEHDELLSGFLDEADEHLISLNREVGQLEEMVVKEEPITAQLRGHLGQVRRNVHTLKGASAVMGLDVVSGLCHALEDYLDWLFDESQVLGPDDLTRMVGAVDALAVVLETPENFDQERFDALVDGLQAKRERTAGREKEAEQGDEVVAGSEHRSSKGASGSVPAPAEDERKVSSKQSVTCPEDPATILRVNTDHVDAMVNLANQLLVGISGLEQRVSVFKEALSEMELSRDRLKNIALELETNFEVKALDDFDLRISALDGTIDELGRPELHDEFDSMELDRYTRLNLIIRSLNEAAIDVGAIQANIGLIHSDLAGDVDIQRRHVRELQHRLLQTRMSPMSSIVARIGRTMRETASRLDKEVRLQVSGEEIELDRVVWEKLMGPLMHLVRNGVHHGIESAERRRRLKKPHIATLSLSAKRTGNQVVIQFGDDGRGIDFDAIRRKARIRGLGEQVESMSERQLTELIFYPGFSTKSVSEISGRGVGLDVVRENIQDLQGNITVETVQDQGTVFIIALPLTLGVVKALMVRVGGLPYAVPVNDIREIRRVDSTSIDFEKQEVTLQGERLPFLSLTSLLGAPALDAAVDEEHRLLLVMDLVGETVVLEIPDIAGRAELVAKGLGSYLQSVKGVSGAAILGDGTIVPVLNVYELTLATVQPARPDFFLPEVEKKQTLKLMIVDDSISVRRVVHRLASSQGWETIEAKDGLEALERLETETPDFILLDVEMPKMNGFDFLVKISNMAEKSRIPVAMLTSRSSVKHREKAYSLGAKGFLNKPYKDEELVELVEELTGYHRSKDQMNIH